MAKGKLGILGGMGPQATLLFYQRVLDFTAAASDQEHIESLILSDTQMPDRTRALLTGDLGPSRDRLLADAKLLENWGAACIAIPCNTSHAFLPWLRARVETPILNMIGETAAVLRAQGARRVGILATDGTVRMGLYHAACRDQGVEAVTPPPEIQKLVMEIIYDEIKAGSRGSWEKFEAIGAALKTMGCDRAVLACTELSVFRDNWGLSPYYLDALDVLARRCVTACGYPLKEEER